MPPLAIVLVVLGVALIVAALAGGWLLGQAMTGRARGIVRVVVGLIGIAAIVIALVPGALPGLGLRGSPGTTQVSASEAGSQSAAPADRGPRLAVDLVGAASSAIIACPQADPPPLPDAASATRAQMDDARRAFEAYDHATNTYTQCVDDTVGRMAKERAGIVPPEAIARLQDFGVRAHNVAVDKEQTFAGQFNQQIRVFNARHPNK